MRLSDALGVQHGDVVSFAGGGGKTSALIRLGKELMQDGWRVLGTATTRIGVNELPFFPYATRWHSNLLGHTRELAKLLDQYRFVFVYQEIRGAKVVGIPDEYISRLIDGMNADVLLVEADGSRRLPLKAPRTYEPAWPIDTTIAVPVAGLDALGKPLDETVVYNPEPIFERYGFPRGGLIQPAWLAQIVRDETLGLKDIPKPARVVALLNKADVSSLARARARRTAQLILRTPGVERVAIGAVQQNDPIFEVEQRIGAVVLAGGLSKRMGHSKALLPWGNQTVIEAIVQKLLPFNLADLVVITGDKAAEVNRTLKKLEIRTVHNNQYATGEMLSSLQTGLRALNKDIGACLVVMGDQPQISPRVVRHLLNAAAQHLDTVVAPYYRSERGHPLLIPHRYWSNILNLEQGPPRQVINQLPITCVTVDTESVLQDIDTPEQYAQAKRLAGLE